MTEGLLPLGKASDFPRTVTPEILYPIARADSRDHLGVRKPLPFHGVDVWNAWELTWLGPGKLPVAATAEIRVAAESPNLIESKSLKLYLNAYAMTYIDDASSVSASIAKDLSSCAESDVEVTIREITTDFKQCVSTMAGTCLDTLPVKCDTWDVDAGLLASDGATIVDESLHTHLLRSLCPVTGQPDIGSLQIHYRGPKIDRDSLLQYVISFREHNDFHEACVERMFVDVLERCKPTRLSLMAHYQRRGGIDINPFRSNFEDNPDNTRLWRQ